MNLLLTFINIKINCTILQDQYYKFLVHKKLLFLYINIRILNCWYHTFTKISCITFFYKFSILINKFTKFLICTDHIEYKCEVIGARVPLECSLRTFVHFLDCCFRFINVSLRFHTTLLNCFYLKCTTKSDKINLLLLLILR